MPAQSRTSRLLSSRPTSSLSRRALLVSAVAVVAPTLALLVLGLQAVQRQRDAIATLASTASRLRLDRTADYIQAQAEDRARACLTDPGITGAIGEMNWGVPEQVHGLRRTLESFCGRHEICRDLVVVGFEAGTPILEEPLPRPLASAIDRGTPRGLLADLESAEALERTGEIRTARAIYASVWASRGGEGVRALALARLARTFEAEGDLERASALWTRLASDYPDGYDLSHRPHAVVAALELTRLGHNSGSAPLIDDIRGRLAAAHWQLSPGQAEYFVAELSDGRAESSWIDSRLFRQFEVARHIRGRLHAYGPPAPGQLHASALVQPAGPRQLFYMSIPNHSGDSGLTLAMEVDLDWVRTRLLGAPGAGEASGGPDIVLEPARPGDPRAMRGAFPFWRLAAPSASDVAPSNVGEMVVFGGSIAGVLSVLVLGVILVVRDVVRETTVTRLKSDLVSGVSHELRTPLSAIRLYAESLADDLGVDDERRSHSLAILHESERLSHLVDRVLDYSRLERDARHYDFELHDPRALALAFAARYRPYVEHLGLALVAEIGPGLALIRADSDAMNQILINLLDNAVKYSGDAREVTLRVESDSDSVTFEVVDHGLGVPMADRARVFQPFFRSANSAGRGGYGLGLHVVAHVVEAHGGRVQILETPGGGTTVQVALPGVLEPV